MGQMNNRLKTHLISKQDGWDLEYLENEGALQRRIISILLTIIFSGITVIQIINILTPPPNGYIFDIYGYFSFFYWVLILGIIILCGGVLSYFSLNKTYSKSVFLIFFALFLISCTLFLQTKMLFFSTGRGDPLYHIGFVKDILFYGNINLNPYPITHILVASFVMLLNISPFTAMNYMPVLFFSVYFLSMYAIGSTFLRDNPFFYYFIGLASLPIFGFQQDQFWPNMSLILFTPFILYVLLKCNTRYFKEFFSLWVLILVFISYGHQLYSMIWILLFVVIFAVYFYYSKYNRLYMRLMIILISFIVVSIIFYYQSLMGVQNILVYIFDILFRGGSLMKGEGVALASQVAQIHPTSSIIIIIRSALFSYGSFAILGLISGFIFLYVTISSLILNQKFNHLLVLASTCSLLCYILALINMVIFHFESVRFYTMGHIFTIILIPLFLIAIIKKIPDGKKYFMLVMMILFVLLAVISVFTIHSSYYFSNFANEQVTESEYNSMTTFLKYQDTLPIIEKGSSVKQFAYSINGYRESQTTNFQIEKPQNDLYYDQYNTFAQGHGSNIYLIYHIFPIYTDTNPFTQASNVTFIDLKTPPPVFDNLIVRKILKFNRKQETDNTVNLIYSNSPTYIYLVR
jgi:hypothetical protein